MVRDQQFITAFESQRTQHGVDTRSRIRHEHQARRVGSEEFRQLTASIIELAGSLNLRPVAEGVERKDQLERLLAMRCEFGQGFLFARPLDRDRLRAILSERAVPAATQ